MTLRLYKSNGNVANDCLGGYMSRTPYQPRHIYVLQDQTQCLRIDAFQLAMGVDTDRAELTIVKVGDVFTVTVSYAVNALGWVDDTPFDVTLAVGATYTASTDGSHVEFTRIKAGSDGTFTARYIIPCNSPLGGDNKSVAGGAVYQYGCIYLYADGDTYVGEITASDDSSTEREVRIWIDPALTRNTQVIANNLTAPTGATWQSLIDISATITDGTVAALWFRVESKGDTTIKRNVINIEAGADTISLVARHYRYDTTIKPYRLYGAYDGRTAGGDYIDEADAIPANIALALPLVGTRDYALRFVALNKYGFESQNQALNYKVSVDAAGDDATIPNAPTDLALTFTTGGHARLTFRYAAEIATPVAIAFVTIGTETHTVEIQSFGLYTAITDEPVGWGESITATAYFLDIEARQSATADVTETAYFTHTSRPLSTVARVGGMNALQCNLTDYATETDGNATVIYEPGGVTILYNGAVVFDASVASGAYIFNATGWTLSNAAISGAQATLIADAGSGVINFAHGGQRRLEIDTVNMTIKANTFLQPFPQSCAISDITHTHDGVLYWQVLTPAGAGAQSWIALEGDNVYIAEINQEPIGT